MPDILATFASSAPPSLQSAVARLNSPDSFLPHGHGYADTGALYVVFAALSWACFFGLGLSVRRAARQLYPDQPLLTEIAPFVALGFLPLLFRYCNYIYDPATLFLSALGLTMLVERRWDRFAVTFAVACYNKETAILMVAQFIIAAVFVGTREGRLPWPRIAVWSATFTSVWASIQAAIHWRYAINPQNNWVLQHGSHLKSHNLCLMWETPFTFLYFVAVSALFALLCVRGWRSHARFLRYGLLVTLLPLAAACFLMGFVDELRDYYEAWPFLVLLILPTLGDLIPGKQAVPRRNL